jgi:phosphoglycolate phosphatase-like HAD superfamily hydrolase
MKKLVLFDIDGTLLLSLGAGRRALVAAMAEEMEDPAAAAAHVRFDGKTDPQIVLEMFDAAGRPAPTDQDILRILDRYLQCLRTVLAHPTHRTEIMPGVPDLLDRIEAEGRALLGLLTGNVAAGAELKLRSGSIDPNRFRVGAFGSDHAVRAELPAIAAGRAELHFGRRPEGEEIVIIGDTPSDVTCGAAVGARAIGVATGSYSAAELSRAGAFAVFEDLSDVAAVWRAISA